MLKYSSCSSLVIVAAQYKQLQMLIYTFALLDDHDHLNPAAWTATERISNISN